MRKKNSPYPGAGYPDRLDPPGKFVKNSIKLIVLKLPAIGSSTVQHLATETSNSTSSQGLYAGKKVKQYHYRSGQAPRVPGS